METTFNLENAPTTQLEKAVVCSLLLEQQNLPDVIGWLTPEMFLNADIGFIYSALLAQYQRGERPDYITTEAEMRRMDAGRCERISGVNLLADGIVLVRHNGNMHRYAEEVKRLYTLRMIEKTLQESGAKAASPESDPAVLLREVEEKLLKIEEECQVSPPLRKVSELLGEALEIHQARVKGEQDEEVVMTGLYGLDAIFGGLQGGELYVLGGRPGDGKTAVALQMAIGAVMRGKEVIVFSLEMSNLQMMNRILTGHSEVDEGSLRLSNLTEKDFGEMEGLRKRWKNLPLYMDYTPGNSAANIRAQVLLHSKRCKCNLVVIDYLHLLDGKAARGETPDQVIGRNVLALKKLALEAGCAVLVLSQMNRQIESRSDKNFRPHLSDLRDSGVIEQAADGVFFIYRPDRHGITHDPDTNEKLEGACDLIVCKNRNGSTGRARLRHNGTFTRFADGEGDSTFFS
ncbi:MAG: AAA family ATPase [Bacteroides sp.]|nr:AAA family ATPase [Bacteroides sp.]